jgi:NADH-quinone oxidoreductase subunit I
MQVYPATFDIDISVCMSCQICVEVCPFESIKMDTKFELSTDDRFGGLLLTKDKLAKSNSYYQKMHPQDAAESDAVIAGEKAKAEAKAKAAAEAKVKADAEAKAKAAAAAATTPIAAPTPTTPPPPAK